MSDRTINLNDVPESTVLPATMYTLVVDDIVEQPTKADRFMYKATFKVAEGEYTGTPLFDYYAIGTAEDPLAREQATWNKSIGAQRLRRLAKACLVPMDKPIDEVIETLKGQRFSASVIQEVDDGSREGGKYRDRVSNRISAMYTIGMAPGATGPGVTVAPTPRPKASASASSTLACPFCAGTVERSKYNVHIKTMHPDEV